MKTTVLSDQQRQLFEIATNLIHAIEICGISSVETHTDEVRNDVAAINSEWAQHQVDSINTLDDKPAGEAYIDQISPGGRVVVIRWRNSLPGDN